MTNAGDARSNVKRVTVVIYASDDATLDGGDALLATLEAKSKLKDGRTKRSKLVFEMTAHARATNPQFFVVPQNAPFILDALGGGDLARPGWAGRAPARC